MPDELDDEAARMADQVAREMIEGFKRADADRERLLAEAMDEELKTLRDALHRVRTIAGKALADTAPNRTVMVVKEFGDGDIIACRGVSDSISGSYDKKTTVREFSKQLGLCVDFIEIQGRTLTSAEACMEFVRHFGSDCDGPITNVDTEGKA